jgi:NAD(P)H-hydrate epimerase
MPSSSQPQIVTQLPVLPPRPPDSNKGSFGKVLIVAGSRGMSGAAVLAGSAALRGGAGLVRVAVPAGVLPIVACANPCYLTAPLPEDADGRVSAQAEEEISRLMDGWDVAAIGPGFGRGQGVTSVVHDALRRLTAPLVLDADGLNTLEGNAEPLRQRQAPLIITPHPGEFARLTGKSIAEIQQRRQELAVAFAAKHRLVLVLKGHGTIVTDGRRLYVNTTGNPGMATGGTGDVLTGLIAALLGQGLEPFAAAQLGVHRHGLAGDLARDHVGAVGMIASDLLTYLPQAARTF